MRMLMLMLLAGLAGCGDVRTDWACGTQAPPPPQVTVLRVLKVWTKEEGGKPHSVMGTGFPITADGIISCRHELPSHVRQVYVEGKLASILDRGSKDVEGDDWIHVEFQSPPSQIPILDPKVPLRPGERVAIVGFLTHGIPKDRLQKWLEIPVRTVYGRTASNPFWLDVPEEVVLIKAGDAPLNGMSGGPVMVLRDNKWVVFGFMVGKVHQDGLSSLFSSTLLCVRRLPEHLLEK